jgi:hypothetical protein
VKNILTTTTTKETIMNRQEILDLINDHDLYERMTDREIDWELQNKCDALANCIDRTSREEKIYQLLLSYLD